MPTSVRRIQYFYATVRGEPDDAYGLLTHLAEQGVNLVAINTVPMGPEATQLTLFPDDTMKLRNVAQEAGLALEGPHDALLVQGDDEIGAVAKLHARLNRAGVHVYASNAVTDGRGYFGYVLYLRGEQAEQAAAVLKS